MISLFPIPLRKLISIKSDNEILSTKRTKAWQITLWSEDNINFLFKYAAILFKSQIQSELISSNVIGSSSIQIKYSNAFSEGCLILWNIASILSNSLIYFPLNDKKTREVYKERIEIILQIFYSLQNEFLPSIQINSKSDFTIQNVAFYHTVYSAHYYEILLLIGEANNEDLTTMTLNNMIAENFFKAASKINPFPSNFSVQKNNHPCIDIIVNKISLYRIKSLVSQSQDEERKLQMGSSIYYLNLALEAINSSPKSFRSTEIFTEINQEVLSKKKIMEEYNRKIYFNLIKCENSLPKIQSVNDILHSGINPKLEFNFSNNENIKQKINELNQLIDKQREMLINSADSISVLTSLIYECDSSRKKINSRIFASSDPNNRSKEGNNELDLPSMLSGVSKIENDINLIFNWLSLAKTAHPSSFDVDNSCEKLSNLQEKLKNTVGKYFVELDPEESERIISSIKGEVILISISQKFLDDIAVKTDECFQIMEKISLMQ